MDILLRAGALSCNGIAKRYGKEAAFGLDRLKPVLPEVAPVVELVGIFGPAVAYVCAVVHVGD